MRQWSGRREEFVKRSAFALLAGLALHDKKAPDEPFLEALPLAERAAADERNFVKKGVSWALRTVGRRNRTLNAATLVVARRLAASLDTAPKWVGRDVLKELTSPAVQKRLADRAIKATRRRGERWRTDDSGPPCGFERPGRAFPAARHGQRRQLGRADNGEMIGPPGTTMAGGPPMPTRRQFVKDATLLAAAPVVGGLSPRDRIVQKGPVFAYIGTYSSGGNGNGGRGIHIFEVDAATGGLTERDVLVTSSNPSALALGRTRTHLYAGNEVSNFEGGKTGSVSAYAIDRASGRLTLVNSVSAQGAGPAHVSVHPAGKHLFVANYGGGSVAVLPIRPDGGLGAATDTKIHEGVVGPVRATNAPPGSFAISGHNSPHAHMIQSDPSGRYVLATDLGLDVIFVWRFDRRVWPSRSS